ncbi:HipA family kinase [Roseateles sp. So40a]|uniref:HipA family kinase n=1 Tax=Roseateles sp. So40a TaxID=3400226 RepID=UPI003A8430BA
MRHSTAQIIPLRRSSLREIRTASIHSAGVRINGSRNEVWLCPAYSGADTVMLYVKPGLTVRQLVAELVAAQVGHCLGLPCPDPFIASVAPHHVGRARGPTMLAFGCQQVGPTSLAYPVRNLSLMLDLLRKAKATEGVCVLDEWIANAVRGPGDIVFDAQQSVWLIDHEGALEAHIRPDEAVTNWLAGQLDITLQTRSERAEFLGRLHQLARSLTVAQIHGVPPEMRDIERGDSTYAAVLEFLAARLDHLGSLLSARVIPEQRAFDMRDPSNDSASIA